MAVKLEQSTKIPFARRAVVALLATLILFGGILAMSRFMIAEGAITLAAFPLSIAIVGTYFWGRSIALVWAVTLIFAFYFIFGLSPVWAILYGLLYGVAAGAIAAVLRHPRFGDLLNNPVKFLFSWYVVVGIAAPLMTTLLGVPLLIAGGGAGENTDIVLLMISNFISDSFSPVSLGLGLFAPIAVWKSTSTTEIKDQQSNLSEKIIWLSVVLGASLAIIFTGELWTRNGINDVTPAFYLLLAWSALRFSLSFTMMATAGVGLLVTSCVTFGLGGTAIPVTTQDALSVYANLLALTILAQTSAAMTLQRSLDNDRAIEAELDRAQLKRYFSPAIAEEVLSQSTSIGDTKQRNLVVMFIDFVGFTSIAETQSAEQTIAMLREFDSAMEQQLFDHGGVVDKYIGDGVMAAFGLPQESKADAVSAVKCAIAMVDKTADLARQRKARGDKEYGVGIGIHCGEVVTGNVGSERNLSFTIIGDTVNTASRLEGLSRGLEATIVISDDVARYIKEELGQPQPDILKDFVNKGDHLVKGRQQPVSVWVLPRLALSQKKAVKKTDSLPV